MAGLDALSGATIAFDLDGTLVDTAPDLIGTLNVILAQEGLAPLGMDDARALIGHGAMRLLERGFDVAGATIGPDRRRPLFDRFIEHYLGRIADESRPFPGVVEALAVLKAAGAKLCVCTNKPTDLSEALLAALDLDRWFEAVVGPDAVPARKPDPVHLTATVARVGGSIQRTIMVGDAAPDAGAARAAGAGLILVDFGYTDIPAAELAPDVLIRHFDELPDACLRLLGPCPARGGEL